MNPVSTALLSGALIIAGKWARGQEPNIENGIGIAGIAVCLAILDQINVGFSRAFAVLIVLSLAIVHLPAIVKGVGFGEI